MSKKYEFTYAFMIALAIAGFLGLAWAGNAWLSARTPAETYRAIYISASAIGLITTGLIGQLLVDIAKNLDK